MRVLPSRSRLAIALFMLLTTACAGGAESGDASGGTSTATEPADADTGAEPQELTTVRYADQVRTTQFAPIFVAQAKNMFEENGIEFDAITLEGRSALPAIAAGELDFIGHATHGAVLLRSENQPVKALVALQTPAINSLIVRTDLDVDELEDLKGLRVAVTGMGGTTHDMLSTILEDAGMDPDEDVTIVELGGDPAGYIAAFQRGDVDAAMTFQPAVSVLVNQMEIAKPLVSLGANEGPEILQDIATTLLVSDRFVEENPEATRAVAETIAQAQAFMRDPANFDEVMQILMEELNMEEEDLRPALEELIPHSNPEITHKMVDSAHEFLHRRGSLDDDVTIPYEEVVAPQAFQE